MTIAFNRDCNEKRKHGRKTKYETKAFNYCPKCHSENKNPTGRGSMDCFECGHRIDFRIRVGVTPERTLKFIEWCNTGDNRKIHSEKARRRERAQILKKVGRGTVACVNCGCNDIRVLEINHINGGGTIELKRGENSRQFLRSVLNGTRGIDDLNLLCKICNAEHFIKMKFGINNFTISWRHQ